MLAARAFVTLIFLICGACFIWSTWLLYAEFRDHDWQTLILAHSHLFVFFPTFGLLALAAFHLPASVFTHLYWNHIPYGRVRFIFGFFVLLAATWYVSVFRLGPQVLPRAVWEVAPKSLELNQSCAPSNADCRRMGILPALQKLRRDTDVDVPLHRFARVCDEARDALIETPIDNTRERWCYPANRKLNASACCKVQEAFSAAVASKAANPQTRSRLADWDQALQPVKAFFVLVLIVIGIMLVVWRRLIETHYGAYAERLQRNVFIGGVAMLLWPLMDYAYLDVSHILFGRATNSIELRLSLVIAPWSLLLLFYFLQRFAAKIEVLGQIAGVAGGLAAILVRDDLKDWAAKLVGIGTPAVMVVALGTLLVIGFIALAWPIKPPTPNARAVE